jgi:hypothetical protein
MKRSSLFVTAALGIATALTLLAPSGASAAGAGQFCGGIAGIRCAPGLFCEYAGGRCGIADAGGKCLRRPRLCPRIFRPVCGCNGKTYSNDCVRQAAGVSKRHHGRC